MSRSVHLAMTANGDAVEGESTVTSLDRGNTIECLKFLHMSERNVGSDGRPSGKPYLDSLEIRKRVDKASPLLQKAFENSEVVEGRFKFFRANPAGDGTEEHFMTIRIDNARIASIKIQSATDLWKGVGSQPVIEIVRFVAGELTYTYESTGAEHTIEFFAKSKK